MRFLRTSSRCASKRPALSALDEKSGLRGPRPAEWMASDRAAAELQSRELVRVVSEISRRVYCVDVRSMMLRDGESVPYELLGWRVRFE
jgi:hypothetical protein